MEKHVFRFLAGNVTNKRLLQQHDEEIESNHLEIESSFTSFLLLFKHNVVALTFLIGREKDFEKKYITNCSQGAPNFVVSLNNLIF